MLRRTITHHAVGKELQLYAHGKFAEDETAIVATMLSITTCMSAGSSR